MAGKIQYIDNFKRKICNCWKEKPQETVDNTNDRFRAKFQKHDHSGGHVV